MATTTTNFGWDIPQSTDLVKDGATAIAALGQDIDTAFIDLKGGTTGQILSKASATDLDYTWITNDVGDITGVTAGTGLSGGGTSGAVTVSIDTATTVDKTTAQTLTNKTLTSPVLTTPNISTYTTSGDIVYGTGSGAISRLGVGTTGQILTVAAGVPSWSAPGGSSFVGCSLGRTADQTMSNNAVNEVLWTTEAIDTNAFHDTSTNTGRLTIPAGKAGKYLIGFALNFASNSTGVREVFLKKNGSDFAPAIGTTLPALSGGAMTMNLTTIVSLAEADYITANIYQNSGGNLAATFDRTFIYLQYLGA
jgi:hypothetical protein